MTRDDAALAVLLDAVARGHAVCMTAQGSSMWPAIPGGTLVELSPLGTEAPAPGAVVAARRGDGVFLIHRVRGVRHDGGVLLQGDNCPRPDGWFRQSELCAQVRRVDLGRGLAPVSPVPLPRPSLPRRALAKLQRHLSAARAARPSTFA